MFRYCYAMKICYFESSFRNRKKLKMRIPLFCLSIRATACCALNRVDICGVSKCLFPPRPCRSGLGADLRRDVELPPLHLRGGSSGDGAAQRPAPGSRVVAVGGEDRGGDALCLKTKRKSTWEQTVEKTFKKIKAFLFCTWLLFQKHWSKGPHLYHRKAFDTRHGRKITCPKKKKEKVCHFV